MTKKSDWLIIFTDLIGSTEVANELKSKEYADDYIKSFYFAGEAALNFIKKKNKSWKNIKPYFSGDEILILKEIKNEKPCIEKDIVTALSFAYTLKLYWLLSPYTVNKIKDKKPPREIACGLHIGDIEKVSHSSSPDDSPIHASYDINIAKRVETSSRKGISSNIYATNFIGETFNKWRKVEINKKIKDIRLLACTGFETAMPEPLKGISGKVWVRELVPKFGRSRNEKYLFKILEIIIAKKAQHEKPIVNSILLECIKTFYGQASKYPNPTNKWVFNPCPLTNKADLDKYLTNLIYLSKCSANLWFKFNAFYIASALTKVKSTSEFSQNITEILDDLKELYNSQRGLK